MIDKLLKWGLAASFVVYLFLAFYQPLEFEDGWWHLATGRWIIEHHQVPSVDPYAFTDKPVPWIFTKWLGSALFYLSYLGGGYEGVKLFRMSLFLIIMGIFLWYSRRKVPFPLLIFLSALLVYPFWTRCFFRPDVFNYIFIQIFLIQIFQYQRDRDRKRLWSLPLLGCLWGNIHLGSFVFGGTLVFMLVLNSLFFGVRDLIRNKTEEARRFANEFQFLSLIFILFMLSLAVGPDGLKALEYSVNIFWQPNFIGFYKTAGIISEQLPPTYIFYPKGIWFWFLFVGGVVSLIFMKRNRLLSLFVFVFPLLMFLHGRRASIFFALSAVYIIVEFLDQISIGEKLKKLRRSRMIAGVFCLVMTLFFLLKATEWRYNTIYDDHKFQRDASLIFDPRNPVRAVEFLLNNGIKGKVFTNDYWGGYFLWKAYPALKPFVDGRQLDQELFMTYTRLTQFPPQKYWDGIEREHGLNIAVIDISHDFYFELAKYLLLTDRWQLIFIDGRCVVLVRKGLFSIPEEARSLQERIKAVPFTQTQADLLLALDQMPLSQMMPMGTGSLPPHYVRELEEGYVLFGLGFQGEGISRILGVYNINPMKTRVLIARMFGAYGIRVPVSASNVDQSRGR